MPSAAAFTVSDVLDRGIAAVPDVLRVLPDTAVATRDDIDGLVKSAFTKASVLAIDQGLISTIISAGDPLARATAVIAAKYSALGEAKGILGATAGDVTVCPDGFGYYRHYRNGSIFWHPAAGVHEVHGQIRAKWAALGWERSVVGYPTSDQLAGSDPDQRGAFNTFQGGAIHWYPPGFGGLLVGTVVLSAAVLKAEVSVPVAKKKTTRAAAVRAAKQTFVGEALGGIDTVSTAITLLPENRVFASDNAGLDVARLLGTIDAIGSRTAVVFPGELPTVLGSSAGAFEVHGDIGVHYRALGGSGSVLGYPTTDETGTPDGVGRYNHFQAGSIYWTPGTGAHEVHGLIRAFWSAAGWERNSALGYPISDELVPDRRIGHRFPERKKKNLGLPPDVIKFPAEAVISGFSPVVANVPLSNVVLAQQDAVTLDIARGITVGRASRTSGLKAAVNALTVNDVASAAHVTVTPVAPPKSVDHLDVTDVRKNPISVLGTVLAAGPGSSPASVDSDNRFGDFENGVVFWRRGASAAATLSPWATSKDGQSMKRSPDDVVRAFDTLLMPALAGLGGAQFAGTAFAGTTSYSWDGATVHNRAHRLRVSFVATQRVQGLFGISTLAPVVVAAELRVETAFDPQRRTVVAYLADWTFADATDLTASPPLLRQLHPRLDALLYRRVDLIDVPDTDGGDPIALLSAKTLPDGTVAIYIEPGDPRFVVAQLDHISDALHAVIANP